MKISGLKRLHILILKSFIGPFFLVFFIVLFVLLMQFLWRYIDELVGKGLEMSVFAKLILYTSASLVPMALPLAILMSSLMTFGNMGEYYELTAIKASGISLQRIIFPLVILIVFISFGAFFFANRVLPFTNLKMKSLLYDVRKQRPEIVILPGAFFNGMTGYSIRIERRNASTNMMYDVKIYDHTANKGNSSVIIADSGSMIITTDKRNLILNLYDGYSYNEVQEEHPKRSSKTYPHRYDKFKEQQLIIELVGFDLERTDESLFRGHYQMMNISQLETMKDSVKTEISNRYDQMGITLASGNRIIKSNISGRKSTREANFNDSMRFKNLVNARIPDIENLPPTIDLKETSIESTKKQSKISKTFYQYLDQLTTDEKNQTLNTALSYARNSKSYVISTTEAVDFKVRLMRRYEIEWHRKFTLSIACIVFLLIGAPLGAIIRKGGLGLPLVISTLLFIFYYIFSLTGEKLVRESYVPAYEGMWQTTGIFFIVGVFLTYKATRDASILNFDTYSHYIKKFIGSWKINLLEVIKKESQQQEYHLVKEENLYATLTSFLDSINEQEDSVNHRLKLWGFLVSLVGLSESSDIILFERFYKNIVSSMANSDLYGIRPIRSKIEEFPNFNHRNYIDLNAKLYLRLILLLLPPLTLLIMLRHYIRLLKYKARLKLIYGNTIDIMVIVKQTSMNS